MPKQHANDDEQENRNDDAKHQVPSSAPSSFIPCIRNDVAPSCVPTRLRFASSPTISALFYPPKTFRQRDESVIEMRRAPREPATKSRTEI
jgi:hypothetical protein